MPYTTIYLHSVWATKDRVPILSKDIRPLLFDHFKENAKLKGIYLDTIGGHNEHVHCLISLTPTQTLANIMNLLKGESSFWINKNKIIKGKFEWQDEYFAVSVSPTSLNNVRQYIINQEQRHQKKSFAQEYEEFIKACGIEI